MTNEFFIALTLFMVLNCQHRTFWLFEWNIWWVWLICFAQNLDFKFPLSVSCIHFICSSIGAYIAIKVLKVKPLIEVDPEDRWRRIFPMSFVFCINIVLGNVSLRYIPVSFMQTIKSFTPATTGLLLIFLWWLNLFYTQYYSLYNIMLFSLM